MHVCLMSPSTKWLFKIWIIHFFTNEAVLGFSFGSNWTAVSTEQCLLGILFITNAFHGDFNVYFESEDEKHNVQFPSKIKDNDTSIHLFFDIRSELQGPEHAYECPTDLFRIKNQQWLCCEVIFFHFKNLLNSFEASIKDRQSWIE